MFGGEGVYWIRNRSLSTKFIDVRGEPDAVHGGERPSMPIGLFSSRLVRAQLWLVEQVPDGETFVFRNFDTGTVLDIKYGSPTEGTPIVVNPYNDTGENASSQHWKVVWVSDDQKIPYYRITNQKTGTVVDQTTNTKNGADFSIESWNNNNTTHQHWTFERATFPTMYWLVNTNSGRCLGYSPSSTNDANLNTPAKFPSRDQLWYLEDLADFEGYCKIRNVDFEGRIVSLSGADNTTILSYTPNGNDNQRWKITDDDLNGVYSVVSEQINAVMYSQQGREGIYYPRGTPDANAFASIYQWRLIPCTIPSLFWTTLQCRASGKFVAQSGSSIVSSDGARGEIDYTVQWRFVPQGRNLNFTIVNRKTGNSLSNPSGSSLAADNNATSNKYYWVLDAAGQDCSITNVSSSNVIACHQVTGNIQALSGGATDTNRQWLVNPSLQSVPSFAIVNGKTGNALAYVPNVTSDSVEMDTAFNAYRCQWILQQVGNDTNDRPIFVIINKLSDNVLDHWNGTKIEALNDDPNNPLHHWKLVPCHKRYFAIMNVSTGNYLYDDGTAPTGGNTGGTMTDEDLRCCWTFVSHRESDYDTITLDTDISEPSATSHHIVKRGAKKTPKGKGTAKSQPDHIPDNPRILQVTNRVLLAIVTRLVDQWDIDTIPASQQAGRPASTSRAEVIRWGIDVPRALQEGWTRPGWIRIDIQGTYIDQNGIRVANIQGQWNTDTVFHVIVPTGVNFGREMIRQAMLQSLRTASSVRLDVPDNNKAGGSKNKPNTTPKPPGPGAPPPGQIWAAASASWMAVAFFGLMLL